METSLKIGDKVKCKKFGSLKHDFNGVIEKIYENSAMVSITNYSVDDKVAVSDFHDRAVVALNKMKKMAK